MLDVIALELTKNEIAIYQLIKRSSNFTYSLSEVAQMINLTRQTVVKSLQTLVAKKLVMKTDFFVGKVRRCRYKVVDIICNGLNGQNNLTSPKKIANPRVGNKKRSTGNSSNLTKIINKLDKKIINNKYINNIYQKDITTLPACQDTKIKNFAFFSKKQKKNNSSWDTEYQKWNKIHNFEFMADTKYWDTCKYVLKNMLKEGNTELVTFLGNRTTSDVHSVMYEAMNKLGMYAKNIKSSVGGYFRKIILSTIATYDVTVDGGFGVFAEETNSYNSSYKNFEQRRYSKEYLNSFYVM